MRRFRSQKGMTLVELLIALSISIVIVGGLGSAIYTIMNVSGRGNAEINALRDIQNASFYIRKDARDADAISLPVTADNVTLWSGGHVTKIYRTGTELFRDYDGKILKIAWDISDISFEVDNMSILTYYLASSPPGKWDVTEELTAKVYMDKLP